MNKILVMFKGRLTDEDFKKAYSNPIKQLFQDIEYELELMPVYFPAGTKKVSKALQKEWLESISVDLKQYNYLLVTEPEYFKTISKQTKAESNLGLIFDTEFDNKALYLPSTQSFYFNPDKTIPQIEQCLKSLSDAIKGIYSEIGSDIIHFEEYPTTISEIKDWLEKLKQYPSLTCDIEAKSLKVTEAGIYTIGFAWNKHEGICFPVDAIPEQQSEVRKLLLDFFSSYTGKLIVHKANYDIPVICYTLFQNEDITDIKNQIHGLNTLCRNLDDTLLVTYLATNSCGGNILGLKELAQPFAGHWAVDVSDVTKVDLHKLMKYNLIDCLSTWFVYETYYPKMVNDSQEQLYKDHFLPYLKDNMRCQLNGLPIDLEEVSKLKESLNQEKQKLTELLGSKKSISNAEFLIASETTLKRNAKLKKKVTTVEENKKPFNYNSSNDLAILLYEVMQLPLIDLTDSKQPSTSKPTIKKLLEHTENQEFKEILQSLMDLSDVEKMLTAFIPAFEKAHIDKYGNAHLIGYINAGGTVSGRMSSNSPNLANLPATGSRFAKPIKKCFKSTEEWIYCGIDFNALESRIDALTTKDPNKLKVYTDGLDSHSFNAFVYWSNLMPDITDTVDSINSVQSKYKSYRQDSKKYTFALQYGSTEQGLVSNCGATPEDAKRIYTNYHQAYVKSLEWKNAKLNQAQKDGYVTVAFGLRVRTPVLSQFPNTSIGQAEARTAGNALGQGWGMLNDRAMNEVLNQVDKLGLNNDILPVNKIHDCCYYLVRNDIQTISTLNTLCTNAAKWQNHPDIEHPDVGLSGQLDLFYPDWSNPITLPEQCNEECLLNTVQEHLS